MKTNVFIWWHQELLTGFLLPRKLFQQGSNLTGCLLYSASWQQSDPQLHIKQRSLPFSPVHTVILMNSLSLLSSIPPPNHFTCSPRLLASDQRGECVCASSWQRACAQMWLRLKFVPSNIQLLESGNAGGVIFFCPLKICVLWLKSGLQSALERHKWGPLWQEGDKYGSTPLWTCERWRRAVWE